MSESHSHLQDPQPPHPSAVTVLDALHPLLTLFQPFLDDDDAARLLRTSRTAALALLPGYTFTSHIFQPTSLASLLFLRRLCLTYRLRITQLDLPASLRTLTFNAASPRFSPIPASVTALSLCYHPVDSSPRWAAFSAAAADWPDREPWRLPDPHPSPLWFGAQGKGWQLTLASTSEQFDYLDCPIPCFADPIGDLDCPLPPGLLHEGLRLLRFNSGYNHPLQPGSLPSSLTFLQLGAMFDQPLAPGILPASLRCLSMVAGHYHHRLVQGSLPASLERLSLWHWSQPLEVEVLPPRLKTLHLHGFNHPLERHVLPLSLLFLSLDSFSKDIRPGHLPPSLVELRLGWRPSPVEHRPGRFHRPLHAGALPASLRRLTMSNGLHQRLQLRSLPEGLLFFRFNCQWPASQPPLQPGVLPSTLLGIDFANFYHHPLPAGVVPSAVQWIRLSSRYRDERIEAVLSPYTEVRWCSHEHD